MCVGLPRNTSGEEKAGSGMQLSTVQSRKTGMLESPEEWWQQEGIPDGQVLCQTYCLSGKIPGKTRSAQGPFTQQL